MRSIQLSALTNLVPEWAYYEFVALRPGKPMRGTGNLHHLSKPLSLQHSCQQEDSLLCACTAGIA